MMNQRWTQRRGLLALISAAAFLATSAMAQSQIQVGPNVLVSKDDETFNHTEVIGAADPNHPERLIVCSIVASLDEGRPWTAAYVSFDGGKSFSKTVEHVEPRLGNSFVSLSADPTCAYGPDGSAYFAAVSVASTQATTLFFRSLNGGKNWSSPTTVFGAWDRPFIAIDGTNGKYHGRIYISHTYSVQNFDTLYPDAFNSALGVGLQRSTDGGRTFIGPVARSGLSGTQHLVTNPGNTVVLSDGTVVTLFFEGDPIRQRPSLISNIEGSLKIMSSEDGGQSFGNAVKVADHFEDRNRGSKTSMPNIAVDPGSPLFKDRLYVVWHDSVAEHEEAFLSYSSNKGKTWSRPSRFGRLSFDSTRPDEFQTTVAVNKDGVVAVMWYEAIAVPENAGYWVYLAASIDGGETWLPSVRISERPNTVGGSEKWPLVGTAIGSDPITVRFFRQVWQASGDTAGLTADSNGVFHSFWIDNRTGTGQIWTSPISVLGPVLKNGAEQLSHLEDVSKQVIVEVNRVIFDSSSNELSTIVRLKNVSSTPLNGPLKLRVFNVSSDLGIPEMIKAEGGIAGDIINFQSEVLKPGEFSKERELKFRVLKLRTFRSNQRLGPLVQFNGRVFGRVVPDR